VRQFPWVDAAVSGEGEVIFPQLVRRVLAGEPLEGLPGVRTRQSIDADFREGRFGGAPGVKEMDSLAPPDYRDYMQQFGASRLSRAWLPTLYFETSRGCWWGERQHCTFCGLNGATMTYRSKSASRAVDELTTLVATYPECDIQVSDNILDLGYFKTVLPELARRRIGARLFYETKANLRRDQVKLLRDAGVLMIQPGIESLHDDVLKLMKKGVSALQNIQLLKWCKELGVNPVWNVLWGFPGEPAEAYARMAALVPHLVHLPAPTSFAGLRLDRFSPNFVNAEKLGFADLKPIAPYRYIYDFAEPTLANLAYSFTYQYQDNRDVESYVSPLLSALRRWQRASAQSELLSRPEGDGLAIWDFRPPARGVLTVLDPPDRLLYEACDQVRDTASLAALLTERGHAAGQDDVARRLAPLVARGLMLQDGGRYLSLAIPMNEAIPASRAIRARCRISATMQRAV
jgi:ribosomal peptide maturation radical SAM protein 1